MSVVRATSKAFCYLLVLLLAGLWLKPHAAFDKMPINSAPWLDVVGVNTKLLSSTPANATAISDAKITKGNYGHHEFSASASIKNVTPQMLHWFYMNQAEHSLRYNDQTMSWFMLSHPYEHSDIRIISSPDDRSDQIMFGTIFEQDEVFSGHKWKIQYQARSFGDKGMTLDILHSGLVIGQINYKFVQSKHGTNIYLNGSLGIDLPVIGQLSNFYLFNKVYPSHLLEHWITHLIGSYQHLEELIPALYLQRNNANYQLG